MVGCKELRCLGWPGYMLKMEDLPREIKYMQQAAEKLRKVANTAGRERKKCPVYQPNYDTILDYSFYNKWKEVLEWLQYYKPDLAKSVQRDYEQVKQYVKGVIESRETNSTTLSLMCIFLEMYSRDLTRKLCHIIEMVKADLPAGPTPAEEKEAPDESEADSGVRQSNVHGMSWQEAKTKAEEYLEDNEFLGITKLTRYLGCAQNTTRKAIDNSEILTKAEQQYKKRSGTPAVVTLTDKVLASKQSNDVTDPSILADADAILKKLIEKIPPEKKEGVEEELRNMSDEQRQRTAALYAEQIDDARQDDPKTRKNRRRKP